MFRSRLISPAAAMLVGLLSMAGAPAHAVEILTGNIPPFSIENGERPGFVREIVAEMAKLVGVEANVTYMNWPQAQELAKTQADTLVYPLARTPAREPHYVWIQKLLDMDVLFATAVGRPPVASEAEAKSLPRIGVREGSPMVKDLQDRGFANLVIVKSPDENARALVAGRIDAWYAPAPEIGFNWTTLKLPGAPVWGAKLDSAPLYVAASKNSPGIQPAEWQRAFAKLKDDGTIERILGAYLPR